MLSNGERARVAELEARLAMYKLWLALDNKPQPLATWAEVDFLLALVQRLAGAADGQGE